MYLLSCVFHVLCILVNRSTGPVVCSEHYMYVSPRGYTGLYSCNPRNIYILGRDFRYFIGPLESLGDLYVCPTFFHCRAWLREWTSFTVTEEISRGRFLPLRFIIHCCLCNKVAVLICIQLCIYNCFVTSLWSVRRSQLVLVRDLLANM